jgi:hypothetical protein
VPPGLAACPPAALEVRARLSDLQSPSLSLLSTCSQPSYYSMQEYVRQRMQQFLQNPALDERLGTPAAAAMRQAALELLGSGGQATGGPEAGGLPREMALTFKHDCRCVGPAAGASIPPADQRAVAALSSFDPLDTVTMLLGLRWCPAISWLRQPRRGTLFIHPVPLALPRAPPAPPPPPARSHLGCSDGHCQLCAQSQSRRCPQAFAPKYLAGDAIKAACGASIRRASGLATAGPEQGACCFALHCLSDRDSTSRKQGGRGPHVGCRAPAA